MHTRSMGIVLLSSVLLVTIAFIIIYWPVRPVYYIRVLVYRAASRERERFEHYGPRMYEYRLEQTGSNACNRCGIILNSLLRFRARVSHPTLLTARTAAAVVAAFYRQHDDDEDARLITHCCLPCGVYVVVGVCVCVCMYDVARRTECIVSHREDALRLLLAVMLPHKTCTHTRVCACRIRMMITRRRWCEDQHNSGELCVFSHEWGVAAEGIIKLCADNRMIRFIYPQRGTSVMPRPVLGCIQVSF